VPRVPVIDTAPTTPSQPHLHSPGMSTQALVSQRLLSSACKPAIFVIRRLLSASKCDGDGMPLPSSRARAGQRQRRLSVSNSVVHHSCWCTRCVCIVYASDALDPTLLSFVPDRGEWTSRAGRGIRNLATRGWGISVVPNKFSLSGVKGRWVNC
jgi:hypothetical protein